MISFSLTRLIEQRQGNQYGLHTKYVSPSIVRVLQIIGFVNPTFAARARTYGI